MRVFLYISFYCFWMIQGVIKANPIDSVLWKKIKNHIIENEKNPQKKFYFEYEVSPEGESMLKEYINAPDNSKEILQVENKKNDIDALLTRFNYSEESKNLRFYVFHGRYFLGLSTYQRNTLGKKPLPLKTMVDVFHRDNRTVTLKNRNLWAVKKESFRTLKKDSIGMKNKRIFILFFVEKYELVYEKENNQNQKAKLKKVYEVFWKEEGLEEEEKIVAKKADFIARTHIIQNQTDVEKTYSAEKIIQAYINAFLMPIEEPPLADCGSFSFLANAEVERQEVQNIAERTGNKIKILNLGNWLEKDVKTEINKNIQEKYKILHLISHGGDIKFILYCGQQIGIITKENYTGNCPEPNNKENGNLSYTEILKLNFGSYDLVFSDACVTGVGTYCPMKAFLQKGVESVIAPTANVKDDQASVIVKQFYEEYLGNKKDIADAFISTLKYFEQDKEKSVKYSDWKIYTLRSKLYTREKYAQVNNLFQGETSIIFFSEQNILKAQLISQDNPSQIISFDKISLKSYISGSKYIPFDFYSKIWGEVDKYLPKNTQKLYIYTPSCLFMQDFHAIKFNEDFLIRKYTIIHLL